mgnify:CR=1 FL=1
MKLQSLLLEMTINSLQDAMITKYPGLKLILSYNRMGNYLQIDQIIVPTDLRNTGIGTNVIKNILKYADENLMKVSLTPSSDYGGNKNRLNKFYQSLGFVKNSGKNKDFETRDTLIYLG